MTYYITIWYGDITVRRWSR